MHQPDEAVYRQLHAAIVEQRLPAGCRLTETALAQMLPASRRHVDKALQRLAHERLVRLRRNAGAWVASPTFEEAREIYGLRRVLETAAIRLACSAWRPDGLRALKSNLAAEEAAHGRHDLTEATRRSREFHVLVARLSGNAELARTVEQLVARTSLVTQLHTNPDGLRGWCRHHRDLIETLLRRDGDRSAALMHAHLTELEDALRVRAPASRHHELERALGVAPASRAGDA
jgi:DNA-binding GntR family transcriptional regulator